MKFSERSVMIINLMCTIEQFAFLIGTVWLVGWQGWSGWWFVLTIFLMTCSAPSQVIRVIEKNWGKSP